MPRRRVLVLALALVAALSGCTGEAPSPAAPPAPSGGAGSVETARPGASPSVSPSADREAQERADAWLAAAVVPPDAVAASTTSHGSHQGWWCEGMGLATGSWTIADADVVETANWMRTHPTADLIVPGDIPYEPGDIDEITLGNVPSFDSLEGIAWTVTRTESGVALRTEIGAIGPTTVCPTPAPGEAFGGPGQG